MKNKLYFLLLVLCLLFCLTGCGEANTEPVSVISFLSPPSMEELKSYEDEIITVRGFISTVSPIDGTYIYILSAPFQTCPYCVTTSTGITNTLTAYPAKNNSFDFTALSVDVTGKLVFEYDIDEYGYETEYHLENASYDFYNDDTNEKLTAFNALVSSGFTDMFESSMTEIYTSVNQLNGSAEILPENLFDDIIDMTSAYDDPNQLALRGKDIVLELNDAIESGNTDLYIKINDDAQLLYNDFYDWLLTTEI